MLRILRAAPLIGLAVLLIWPGCRRPDSTAESASATDRFSGSYPIRAVATVGMVGDLVRNVGGAHLAVTQICGPGIDPHLYKPNADDTHLLIGSDIVFYSGLMLEGKMGDALVYAARKKPVHAVTQLIDPALLLEPPEFEGHYDPHVWMDVAAWSHAVTAVESALAEFDPAHASEYQANGAAYRSRLERLHQYGVDSLATIPEPNRILVTSHDAFNYFGRAYGLEVSGVQGLSTDSEAGVQRINELVDLLVQRKVRAVFIESSVPRKNIDALREGASAKGHKVVIGGELFSDAMGTAGTYEGTYEGMLDHNITVVTRALGGTARPGGLNGKLVAIE